MSGTSRKVELSSVGITNPGSVHWNLSVAALYEEAIRRGEPSARERITSVTETKRVSTNRTAIV